MGKEVTKTFATPEGCELVIENIEGQIQVEGWDRPETEIVATGDDQTEIEIAQEGRTVLARARDWPGSTDGLVEFVKRGFRPSRMDYVARVPLASDLKLRNLKGSVHVARVRGAVSVNSVDGSATLRDVSGNVTVETVNGNVEAVEVSGEASLKTVNGKLTTDGGHLKSLSATTVNGPIHLSFALSPEGRYTFNTVNGSCHLAMPAGQRAQVSVQGINASLKSPHPVQASEQRMGRWEGTVGTGEGPAATIVFRTVNGDLYIDESEPVSHPAGRAAAEGSAEPHTPSTTPVEVKVVGSPAAGDATKGEPLTKMEVLRLLERGEIDVDGALARLKELDADGASQVCKG